MGAREGKAQGKSARARAVVWMAAFASVPACALGTDRYWVGNSGNWNTANNWNTIEGGGGSNGVPGTGDNVFIRGATSRTITLNRSYTAATAIGQLLIDSTPPAALTLTQAANNLFAAAEYVGFNGVGLYSQSGGGNTSAASLYLGYNAGAVGTYSLSGTGSVSVASDEFVGYSGAGTFVQSAGTHAITGNLHISNNSGSSGQYTLGGGLLSANTLSVGSSDFFTPALGSFTQTGGTVTLQGGLIVYDGSSYNLTGGTLSTGALNFNSFSSPSLGTAGAVSISGRIRVAAGQFYNSLYVGDAATCSMSIAAGGAVSGEEEFVGYNGGSGAVVQTGGDHYVTYLNLAGVGTAKGTYTLSGGTLSTNKTIVGSTGAATFTQSGGVHTGYQFYVGSSAGSNGTYRISSGQLTPDNLFLGIDANTEFPGGGVGRLEQTGGTINTSNLVIGASGMLIKSAGALTVTGSAQVDGTLDCLGTPATFDGSAGAVLAFGSATLLNTSAVSIIGSPNTLVIFPAGFNPATQLGSFSNAGITSFGNGPIEIPAGTTFTTSGTIPGRVNVSGTFLEQESGLGQLAIVGGLNVASGANAEGGYLTAIGTPSTLSPGATLGLLSLRMGVAALGPGTFVQSGGTLTVGSIYPGREVGDNGTYIMNGGSISSHTEDIGRNGNGRFIQTGGDHYSLDFIDIAVGVGSTGIYELSGGNFRTTEVVSCGANGTGTFVHTGGTFQPGQLNIAGGAGTGTYLLSGNAVLLTGDVHVGGVGHALFNQTGGTGAFHNLEVGIGSSGWGIYNQNAGSLTAGYWEFIGTHDDFVAEGNGTFNQTGGTHVAENLGISGFRGGIGAFNLSAAGSLTVENEYLATGATFTQSGGTHTITNLHVGWNQGDPGMNGSFVLQGGTASADNVEVGSGWNLAGIGSMDLNGGSITVADTILIRGKAGNAVRINGGAVTAANLVVEPGASFTISSGSLSAVLQNRGNITYNGGTLNGQLLNGGTFTLNGSATVTGLVQTSNTPISVGAGRNLTVGNLGLVVMDSSISLAPDAASPGRLTLGGDVIAGGTSVGSVISATAPGAGQSVGVLDLGGARTFSVDDGSPDPDLLISAQIINGSITKTGPGQMELTGSNTFAGGVNINDGLLRVATDGNLGAAAGGVNLNGGTLQITGNLSTSRAFTAGGGAIDVTSGITVTFAGIIGGGSSLRSTGAGTVRLTAANTMTGQVTALGAGVLSLSGANGALASASSIEMGVGSLFELNNSTARGGNHVSGDRIGNSADLILDGGTFNFLGANSVASTETMGHLVVNSGASTVSLAQGSGGTTSVTFSGGLGTRGTAATANFSGATLGTTNKVTLSGQAAGFIGSWATANGTDWAKYSATQGVIPFASADYSTSFVAGTHVRLSASASTGNISILTLALNGAVNVTQTAGTTITLSQGGLLKTGANNSTISGGSIQSGNGALNIYTNTGGTLTLAGAVTEPSAAPTILVKSGPGKLVLGNGAADTTPNTFTAPTYAHAGILELNKAAGTNAIPNDLYVNGATVRLLNNEQIADTRNVYVTAGTFDLSGRTETVYNFTNAGGTVLTGNGTLIVTASQTLDLLNGKTYVGGTVTANGLLVSGGDNQILAGGQITVNGTTNFTTSTNAVGMVLDSAASAPGRIAFASDVNVPTSPGGTAFIDSRGTATVPGTLDLLNGTRNFTVNNNPPAVDMRISARITSGGLHKVGAGLLQLSGQNTYAGGTTISSGTVEATTPSALGTGPVILDGGRLNLRSDLPTATFGNAINVPTAESIIDIDRINLATSANTMVLGSATLSTGLSVSGAHGGTLVLGDTTLTANLGIINNVDLTLSGFVEQSGGSYGITKNGAGVLTISGTPSFTGMLRVSTGRADIAGTLSGPLWVDGGATVRAIGSGLGASAGMTLNGATGTATLDTNGLNIYTTGLELISNCVVTGGGSLNLSGNLHFMGSGAASLGGSLSMYAPSTWNVEDGFAAVDLDVAANISGSCDLVKQGAGTMQLRGNNTFTGSIRITGGVLIASDASLGDASNPITLDGGTLESSAGTARPVVLAPGGGTFRSSANATVEIAANLSGSGSFTKSGPGTTTLSGSLTYTGATNVTAGTLIFGQSFRGSSTLNVSNLARASLAPRNSPVKTLQVAALNLNSTGTLDLNDNDLVVNSGSFTQIRTLVLQGFGSASGGITSSTSDGTQILALFDNALVGAGSWNGQSIGISAVVGKYTYFGDVNFDGQVTGDDYTIIDSNLNTTPPIGLAWLSGDANLDGIVTGDDYTTIDSNLGLGTSNPLSPASLRTSSLRVEPLTFGGRDASLSALSISATVVPEPSIGLGLLCVLLRRRRRARHHHA